MANRVQLLGLVVLFLSNACKNPEYKSPSEKGEITTTYYLIRHAEKDRSDTTNTNPPLAPEGLLRANLWAHYFDTIALDQIYSTNYIRTQETVRPLALNKSISVKYYEPKVLVNQEFLTKTLGQKILISGHSNTTPGVVNSLIGKEQYPDMDDYDNSSLYVVTLRDSIPSVVIRTVALPQE